MLGRAVRYALPVTQHWVATALLATMRVVKLAVLGRAVRYALPVTQDWVATALLATARVVKLAVLGRAVRYALPVTQDWVATVLLAKWCKGCKVGCSGKICQVCITCHPGLGGYCILSYCEGSEIGWERSDTLVQLRLYVTCDITQKYRVGIVRGQSLQSCDWYSEGLCTLIQSS